MWWRCCVVLADACGSEYGLALPKSRKWLKESRRLNCYPIDPQEVPLSFLTSTFCALRMSSTD